MFRNPFCTETVLFCLLSTFACSAGCFAADINLTLGHRSINDSVVVTLENSSAVPVTLEEVYIEFDGRKYGQPSRRDIQPREKMEFGFTITYPALPGTYPLTGAVRYRNDGKLLSLKHTAMYNYLETALLDASCWLDPASVGETGDIALWSSQPGLWRLILPDEMTVTGTTDFADRRVFHVKNALPGFRCTYGFFAVAETAADGVHKAALVSGSLAMGMQKQTGYGRGRAPNALLAACAALFLLLAGYLLLKRKSRFVLPPAPQPAVSRKKKKDPAPPAGAKKLVQRFLHLSPSLSPAACQEVTRSGPRESLTRALAKYACRMFFVTACYLLLKNADSWLDVLLGYTGWAPAHFLLSAALDNLRGPNYEYFFTWFVDCYWGACLLLTLPYLYFFDARTPLEKDKYACFLAALLTLGSPLRGRRPYWTYESRLGMLTVLVKLFYIPYLTSWVINNTMHQGSLIHSFQWSLETVNAFLVALFIYVDTAVYSFGYVVEAGFLKNRIKSVEPTIFGWVVCLWCYPPFNVFSFRLFDHPFVDIAGAYPAWVHAALTCVISLLWGIFAWASVALGFKASNLTNRGIVASGPYRFVRHPAYAAKVAIWIIQGVFFGDYTLGIMLGFALIYFLRAWTEERHLCLDPAYSEYREKVRRWFIPGVV